MDRQTRVRFQFEFIRRSGDCNMYDRACVQRVAYERHFFALVVAADSSAVYAALLDHYERPDEDEYQRWLSEEVDTEYQEWVSDRVDDDSTER